VGYGNATHRRPTIEILPPKRQKFIEVKVRDPYLCRIQFGS
jgi:hypothetical protein